MSCCSSSIRVRTDRYAQLLQKCGNARDLLEGRRVHAQIVSDGLDRVTFLGNYLVLMYGKCRSIGDARRAFQSLQEPNIFSWTIMIGALVENGLSREALQLLCSLDHQGVKLHKDSCLTRLWETRCSTCTARFAQKRQIKTCFELFRQMLADGIRPNEVTFVSLLGVCASLGDLEEAKSVHALVRASEFINYVNVCTALIDVYGKCGKPELAVDTFHKMQHRDLVAWNAMISVCAQHELDEDSLRLFRQMLLLGECVDDVTFIAALDACSNLRNLEMGKQVHKLVVESNRLTGMNVSNSLVNMYGKCGSLTDADLVFQAMEDRNEVSWSAMIAAYSQNGLGKEALELYTQMEQEGMKADEYTFTTLLDACTSQGDLSQGERIHRCMESAGLDTDSVVGIGLINMYRRCGRLEQASLVFNKLEQKSLLSWTTLIMSYAERGGSEAVDLFRQMQVDGLQADDVVLLSVLHGCSHAGLLDDAWSFLRYMAADYGVRPTGNHYGCMVDLLGRVGRLDEAQELLNRMPFEPEAVERKALLSACKVHGDRLGAERAAEVLPELVPEEPAPYLLVSSLYAAASD